MRAKNPRTERAEFASCRALWNGSELTIRNQRVQRSWKMENGLLYATGFRDVAARRQWLVKPAEIAAPSPPFPLPDEPRTTTFAWRTGKVNPVSAEALIVELQATGQTLQLTYRFRIFPDAAGVAVQLIAAGSAGEPGADRPAEPKPTGRGFPLLDALEYFTPAPAHLRLTQAMFHTRSDGYNELMQEQEWLLHSAEDMLELPGNVFAIEDPLTGDGLAFVKLCPLPEERPVRRPYDFRFSGTRGSFWGPRNQPYGPSHPVWPFAYDVALYGHGMDDEIREGYEWVVLAYRGGRAGRTAAIQEYQLQLRPHEPGRDGVILSNTWGDCRSDNFINEAFIRKEIESAGRLCVDVVELDHGWETGDPTHLTPGGGFLDGFWDVDPKFWEVDAGRIPCGLAPLVRAAKDLGMQFGLWFIPDPKDDFAYWQQDAALVLRHHRELGVNYFKVDSVNLRSRRGEENLRRFFDRVLEESRGAVVFDYDVTAGTRSGYFGMCHVGPLFVENRYTDWHRYWPHQTLRNIWKLSHYVHPARLRMEFLNNARNTALYVDDPLAPSEYSPAYLFATTLFTSSLAWFHVSGLPESYFEQIAPIARVWKQHRDAVFGGSVVPIGSAPDGTSWTGFVSCADKGRSGYVLIFRELNDQPKWSEALPMVARGRLECETLAGKGSVRISAGRLTAALGEAKSFLLARFEKR